MPGCIAGMSQAVAIGEDGNICNICFSSSGGEADPAASPRALGLVFIVKQDLNCHVQFLGEKAGEIPPA